MYECICSSSSFFFVLLFVYSSPPRPFSFVMITPPSHPFFPLLSLFLLLHCLITTNIIIIYPFLSIIIIIFIIFFIRIIYIHYILFLFYCFFPYITTLCITIKVEEEDSSLLCSIYYLFYTTHNKAERMEWNALSPYYHCISPIIGHCIKYSLSLCCITL